MKLIIDISEEDYEFVKTCGNPRIHGFKAIQNGIPLDNDSERAEVQAYFAGEAYGWEEGRKALIDDVKAEVEQLRAYSTRFITSDGRVIIYTDSQTILDILDNVGKESEE